MFRPHTKTGNDEFFDVISCFLHSARHTVRISKKAFVLNVFYVPPRTLRGVCAYCVHVKGRRTMTRPIHRRLEISVQTDFYGFVITAAHRP